MSVLQDAEEYLTKEGNLRVPASRYGWDTVSCVPVALAAAQIMSGETGEPISEHSLDHIMSLVVNDHQDIEDLIREYGPEYGFEPEDYLD